MSRFRVGIDIGGTFTDIVFLSAEGRFCLLYTSDAADE